MASQSKQVATRVSPEVWKILQIGLLVEGADTMQDLLRPVVEAYAQELERADEVRAIRASAQKYQDRQRRVTSLRPAASTAPKKSSRKRKAKS